jgi:Uma2 family endonuclease
MNSTTATATPPLVPGERLTRDEFERRYEAMPDVRAELLDGVVYVMASPVSLSHGTPHADLIGWLAIYRFQTPGCRVVADGSLRLDIASEPQPDAMMYIEEDYGGSARVTPDDRLEGGPELVAEIAESSLPYDLNVKLPIYRRNGVREYLLWRVEDEVIDWYVLRNGRYELLQPTPDGVLRSEIFPGLWLDPRAILGNDSRRLLDVALRGLSSPEHAWFVQQLEQRKQAGCSGGNTP